MKDLNPNQKSLSTVWANVDKEDIGAGFKRANRSVKKRLLAKSKGPEGQRVDSAYRKLDFMNVQDQRTGRDRHPFLNGNSRFIFYVLKPPKIVRQKSKHPVPVNYKNKVQPKQRLRFTASLNENIEQTTKFFIEELLPKTQSLMTAISNIDEVMQQITDDKAGIPLEFIKTKAREAAIIRILRFLSGQYGLTKEEQKLLAAEFISKMKPALF